MAKGISIFTGMQYSLEENLEYVRKAKGLGYSSIFTSLHIPEADYKNAVDEFKAIVSLAESLNMKLIADISPRAFSYLNADMNNLKAIKDLGVYGIRVDFGFSPSEIAEFTKNQYGLKIEINASTVTHKFLDEIEKFNPDFSKFQACHNYYPRLNTGISEETFVRKNSMLKKHNMKISSFIPSLVNKRGPIFEGLPTLEEHRNIKPSIAAKHLFALGVDDVIFGDSIPSDDELKTVGRVAEDSIELSINTFNCSNIEKQIIFNCSHENRPDCSADVIRSTNSRTTIKNGEKIKPFNTVGREKGTLTIDNIDYLRYCGELQICKKSLPADARVNVVGQISKDELFLIDYIDEETKFSFTENY